MHQLMDHCSDLGHASGRLEVHFLTSADSTNTRPAASVAVFQHNIILLVGSWPKANAGPRVVFVECSLDHVHLEGVCNSKRMFEGLKNKSFRA